MIRATKDKPSKWAVAIGEMNTVLMMFQTVWESQNDRQGTNDTSRPTNVTRPDTEAALHFSAGAVRVGAGSFSLAGGGHYPVWRALVLVGWRVVRHHWSRPVGCRFLVFWWAGVSCLWQILDPGQDRIESPADCSGSYLGRFWELPSCH